MLNTPILFLIFNRPDTTALVFEAIRSVKPLKLYIAADGYRESKKGEKELCAETKSIIKKIDWNCEVYTLFRDTNLGCKIAVSSAIDWFFSNEESGIIIEDDCLPQPDFFNYCSELLIKYRDNDEIMQIGAINYQNGTKRGTGSYYFSQINHIWGWATWRRAWQKYDLNMHNWPVFIKSFSLLDLVTLNYFDKLQIIDFSNTYNKKIDTWDHQFSFSIKINNGVCICPNVNLVKNIGFGANATHTFQKTDSLAKYHTNGELSKLSHPEIIKIDYAADKYFKSLNQPKHFLSKAKINMKFFIVVIKNLTSFGNK